MNMRINLFAYLCVLIAYHCEFCSAERSLSKSVGPPLFFLQDSADALCLAGSSFKRCAADTLWFVDGKPGSYQIHHFSGDDTELCLDKVQCHLNQSDITLANCNHCGAKHWNFVGDAQSGVVSS